MKDTNLKTRKWGYVINIHVETNHNDIDIRQTNIIVSFYLNSNEKLLSITHPTRSDTKYVQKPNFI